MSEGDPNQKGVEAARNIVHRNIARQMLERIFPRLRWSIPPEELKEKAKTNPHGLLRELGNINAADSSAHQSTKADES